MIPDIYIEVIFRTTSQGGRKTPVSGEMYSCPLLIDGVAYDCRLFLENKTLELGHPYIIPVKFLNKDLVKSQLNIGKKIILWEGKDVAEGVITKICS